MKSKFESEKHLDPEPRPVCGWTASEDRSARLWDVAAGKELLALRGHFLGVESATGKRFITGSWDHTAKIWDARSGNEILTLTGHTAPIRCVAISPDGQRIITGNLDGTVATWDAARPEQVAEWHNENMLDNLFLNANQ